MQVLKKFSLIFFVLVFLAPLSSRQQENVIDQVNKAMKAADAGKVASFFNTTVDLEVGGTDGNFSDKQAEMILKDFFTGNPPMSYTVKHQGSSDDGSKYTIGSYKSANKIVYRVYILLKKSDSGLKINQLQFEED